MGQMILQPYTGDIKNDDDDDDVYNDHRQSIIQLLTQMSMAMAMLVVGIMTTMMVRLSGSA